jgi:hypothetical protein
MINHKAIRALYINAFNIIGSTTSDIEVYDITGNVIEIDLAAVQAWSDPDEYKFKRALEYPPVTDYLDGVVKGNQQQIDAYIAACQAVKAKYPKP